MQWKTPLRFQKEYPTVIRDITLSKLVISPDRWPRYSFMCTISLDHGGFDNDDISVCTQRVVELYILLDLSCIWDNRSSNGDILVMNTMKETLKYA